MIGRILLGLVTAVPVALLLISAGIHVVEEGHVGVYWRGGALLSTLTDPGYHWHMPLVTSHRNIQISIQTDKVANIPCGTSGGVMIYFDKIEVVNRLHKQHVYHTIRNYTTEYDKIWIFDKIHHEINQFCSKHTLQDVYIDKFDQLDESLAARLQDSCNLWAPGIEIISIRVTKPNLPASLLQNYGERERTKTQLLVAAQNQAVVERECETERRKAIIEAEKELAVSTIGLEKQIQEKQGQLEMSRIRDEMHLSKQKAMADSEYYDIVTQARAQQLQYTPENLLYHFIQALSSNTTVVYGDSIPTTLVAPSAASGALLR